MNIRDLAQRRALRTMRLKDVPAGCAPRAGMITAFARYGGYGDAFQVNQTAEIAELGHDKFQEYVLAQVAEFRPHLLILQAYSPGMVEIETVWRIRAEHPGVTIVNFNGDARWPIPDWHFAMAAAVHLSLVNATEIAAAYKNDGCPALFWPVTYEYEYERAGDVPRDPDPRVVFAGNHYGACVFPCSQLRAAAVQELRSIGILDLYGSGWDALGFGAEPTYEQHEVNAAHYHGAALGLSVDHFDQLTGALSDRPYNIAATGCPVLSHRVAGMDELGFVDGKTAILWDTIPEMADKARYYLAHTDEAERIGAAGRQLVTTHHSWDARVSALLQKIGDWE